MKRTTLLCAVAVLACCFSTSASAAIINFDLSGLAGAGLLPGNETGGATGSGSGGEIGPAGIQFDDATKILTVTVGWGNLRGFSDLTGPVSAGHLHTAGTGGGIGGSGGVLQALSITDNTANNGLVDTTLTLDAAQETLLLAGDTYLNFHTAANPAGEIRGNLIAATAVPEPGSGVFLAVIAFGAVLKRKRA